MRLANYIELEQEQILRNWEAFARTMLPAADEMATLALRDHAPQILKAIVADLRADQTRRQQSEKAQGRAPIDFRAADTAAQTHAVLRARSGFDIMQLVAEYRALRASVLRLWTDSASRDATAFDDMMRFDEAIDQAVAESVEYFHHEVEQTRNLLLGMLGHDMRSPLNTVLTTAALLSSLQAGEEVAVAANRLTRSGLSLKSLLDDLMDFGRTRLGLGIKMAPSRVDLAVIAGDEIVQMRGAHPDGALELSITGDAHGHWDGERLQQLVRNLVSNALQYGTPQTPVRVTVRGEVQDVLLVVSNIGAVIPQERRASLFDPLVRGADDDRGLGLGLFIVRAIANGHGGDVTCASNDDETSFLVRLPRTGVAAPA